jgi:hypothetical protein
VGIVNYIGTGLGIVVVLLVIIAVIYLVKRKFWRALKIILVAGVLFFCLDFIGGRNEIVLTYNLERTRDLDGVVRAFFSKYHRYPMSVDEILTTSEWSAELYREFYQTWRYRLWHIPFTKWPDYGIKTYLDDTLIHCISYSFGFDNDNDSLRKVYYNYELMGAKSLKNVLYLVSPLPLDGDIFLGWDVRSVNDYRFDTTFVRQLWELQGDTLSAEKYENWLKKREEFFDNEKRLNRP